MVLHGAAPTCDPCSETGALQAELTALAQASIEAAIKRIQQDLAGLPAELSAAMAARMQHRGRSIVLGEPPVLIPERPMDGTRVVLEQTQSREGDREVPSPGDPNEEPSVSQLPDDLCMPNPWLLNHGPSGCSSRNLAMRQTSTGRRGSPQVAEAPTGFAKFILDPTSWKRIAVDLVGLVLVAYDSWMVPLRIAWGIEAESGALLAITWVSFCFWTVDMMLSFVTASFAGAGLVTDVKQIAWNYLRTYFLLDILAISADAAELLPKNMIGNEGDQLIFIYSVRFFKLGKLVRMRRILANSNVGSVFGPAVQRFAQATDLTTHTPFLMLLPRIIAILVWLVHAVACIWYGIAADVIEGPAFNGLPSYPAALYLVVAMTFGGSSPVCPETSLQTVFTIIYILLCTLFLACITSALAAEMIDAQMRKAEQSDRLRKLGRYLRQHKVTPRMSITVHNQVVERMRTEKALSSQSVTVLLLLSRKLRAELSTEIFGPVLTSGQTVFRACNVVHEEFLPELCRSAVSDISATPGEVVFGSGQAVQRTLVALSGSLQYQRDDDLMDTGVCHEVQPQQWFCELCLWVQWQTQGVLEALGASELVAINSVDLFKVLQQTPDLMRLASDFSIKLSSELRKGQVELCDMKPGLDADAVLAVLPTKQRRLISEPVLDDLAQNTTGLARLFGRGRESLNKLKEEVRKGECHLTQDESGATLRIVQLVAVKIKREDGRICVELGKLDSSFQLHEPVFKVPAVKVRGGEQPEDALQRLLCAGDLSDLQSHLQVGPLPDVVLSLSDSDTYGVRTKYIRREYHARLTSDVHRGTRLVNRTRTQNSTKSSMGDVDVFLLGGGVFAWMGMHQVERISVGLSMDQVSRWLADVRECCISI
mmetsp:Transcript_54487/g.155151  ORF Transcript_54487/g.155151 Transcript_54487/m.155151 type:complete len:879 (+) Transcript_54487:97-2733(+)